MLTADSVAPAWKGSDQDGIVRSSEEFKGKWLLLYFYPKDDTPGCTAEACSFRDRYAVFQGWVHIVGVSADDVTSHKKFQEKYSLPFPLIADPDRTIIAAYETAGLIFPKRTTFLIDNKGVIRKIYKGFDIASHASDIDTDLRNFGA